MLMGISTAAIVNHSFNTPKQAKCPADFMPSLYAKREKAKPKKRFSRKRFADGIRGLFKAMAANGDPRINYVPAPVKGAEKEG